MGRTDVVVLFRSTIFSFIVGDDEEEEGDAHDVDDDMRLSIARESGRMLVRSFAKREKKKN